MKTMTVEVLHVKKIGRWTVMVYVLALHSLITVELVMMTLAMIVLLTAMGIGVALHL